MNNKQRLRRRVLAVIAAFSLTIGVISAPQVDNTEARWLSAEYGRAAMTSFRVQAPIITGAVCEKAVLGLLFNRFEVSWRIPEGMQIAGQTPSVSWQIRGSSSQPSYTTSSPVNGVYTTTFNAGLIADLLESLLGGSAIFEARLQLQPMGWTSQTPSSVHLTIPLLIGNPTCPWTNAT